MNDCCYQLTKAEYLSNLWIALDYWLVLYLSGAVGVSQCAECFIRVRVSWADARYH